MSDYGRRISGPYYEYTCPKPCQASSVCVACGPIRQDTVALQPTAQVQDMLQIIQS
ncbi:hypothetical protein PAXRUDRAFT_829822 [Paxillus rubicundulus Ve08.2h10]|uniref:Uncharacterized protein n=1 Tax=Paxillus rubicundulus Ve08.2h10 TaxID=930991 RepID=A0A0D0E564_9AGAM|nr:hypothetical protein PAXRUDRAFT_829822 [Paxillus rubicundulus Ve08.2h10]